MTRSSSTHAPVLVRLILNDRDHADALARARELMDQEELTEKEADELELLAMLMGRYERARYPLPKLAAHEFLAGLIRDGGHRQIDVARGAGILPSTLSEILNGKREINARQAVKLGRYFKLRGDAFLPRDV
jgi:HTH-type transcriptional regulator/antitoxin HigA